MNHTATFVFPAWQGANDKAVYHGAAVMLSLLAQQPKIQANIYLSTDSVKKNGIVGYDAIIQQLTAARLLIAEQSCGKLLTIGGSCDAEILPISYINQLCGGKLTVVWFDAHGDLNTPESSPSGLFHGMPLRCLLNEGDEQIRKLCFSYLQPRQIVFAGGRDFDAPEQMYIDKNNIPCITSDELEKGHGLLAALSEKAHRDIYIHIDLDVLNPNVFPSVMCPTPGGISVDALIKSLHDMYALYHIAGIGIVEYLPGRDESSKALRDIIACCESILA